MSEWKDANGGISQLISDYDFNHFPQHPLPFCYNNGQRLNDLRYSDWFFLRLRFLIYPVFEIQNFPCHPPGVL